MADPLGLTQWNENGFQSNSEKDEDATPELCKCTWEENFAQKFYVLCFGVICSFLYVLFLNCRWMLLCQKINEIQRWLQTFAGAGTQNKETSSNFPSAMIKAESQWSKQENTNSYSIPNTRCFLLLGPRSSLALRCPDSLQIWYMRWILNQNSVSQMWEYLQRQ